MDERKRLDALVEQYCADRGYHFKPWEIRPWDCEIDEPCPWQATTAGAATWPKAQRLRKQILIEMGEMK